MASAMIAGLFAAIEEVISPVTSQKLVALVS
jgi:hypothetical protein